MSFRMNWVEVHRTPYFRTRLTFDVTGGTTPSKIRKVPLPLLGTMNASNYNTKNDLHMSFRKNWVDVLRSSNSRIRLTFDVTGGTIPSKIRKVPLPLPGHCECKEF